MTQRKSQSRQRQNERADSLRAKREARRTMLIEHLPRLYDLLDEYDQPLNYLRLTQGKTGEWYASVGVWDAEDAPMQCMAAGITPIDAFLALEEHLNKHAWKEDKYTLQLLQQGRKQPRPVLPPEGLKKA